MPVEKDSLLLGVVADLSEKSWGELELLAVEHVLAERYRLDVHADLLELALQKLGHPEDILPVRCISAYAAQTKNQRVKRRCTQR